MKRILALLVAVAATAVIGSSTASAQTYLDGFQFGAGINASQGHQGQHGNNGFYGNRLGGFGFSRTVTREQQPFFAKHPPVYYSHIVKRPYGVSPFAAPAGIAPVEMIIAPPTMVKNPYFQGQVESVSKEVEAEVKDPTLNKSTWVTNPYLVESIVWMDQ